MKEQNLAVIKKEMELVEIIVKQGKMNKENKVFDLHPESYYASMCLYHKALKKALESFEKNEKITYH
jgi:hypothetical protein